MTQLGTGGNIAIPAAERGATVFGVDVTPELLAQARRRAGRAGVRVELTASFLPASPSAGAPPAAWGSRKHVEDVFDAAEARPSLARETAWLHFRSIEDAVRCYARDFGPFVLARAALEPEGRWDAFLAAFEDLVFRFAETTDEGTRIEAEYFVITVER